MCAIFLMGMLSLCPSTLHTPFFEIKGPHGALARDIPQFYTVGIQINKRKDIGMLSFLFIYIFLITRKNI
jgi:hypothetical protein